MRSLVSIGGKVKTTPSTLVDADRYNFLKLSDAEPNLGVPPANKAFIVSDTSGNRSWLNFSNNFNIENDEVVIAPNTIGEDELKISGDPGVLGQVITSDGVGEMIHGPHHSIGVHNTVSLGEQVFDTFDAGSYRAGNYKLTISSFSGLYHYIELIFLHDGSNIQINQLGELLTDNLGTFGGRINEGYVELLFTPKYAENQLRFTRQLISISGFEATFPQDLQNETFGDIDLQTATFGNIDLNAIDLNA